MILQFIHRHSVILQVIFIIHRLLQPSANSCIQTTDLTRTRQRIPVRLFRPATKAGNPPH